MDLPDLPNLPELLAFLGEVLCPGDLDKPLATSGKHEIKESLKSIAEFRRIKARLARCFQDSKDSKMLDRASKLLGCQRSALVFQARSQFSGPPVVVVPYSCNQRVCPECARSRSIGYFIRSAHLAGRIRSDPKRYSLITLTVKNPPLGRLSAALDSLATAWRQLRRTPAWRSRVRGYIWALEITFNQAKSTWHPHVHALADMDFWPMQDLRATWQRLASTRGLVAGSHIRAVSSADDQSILGAILELCKYVMKPIETDNTPPAAILEITRATASRRTKGSAGSLQIPGEDRTKEAAYECLGGLDKCANAAIAAGAKDWLALLHQAIQRNPKTLHRIATTYPAHIWWTG